MGTEQKNIAVIGLFSEETSDRLQELRAEIAEKFDVREALSWPPHVTLRPGLIVPSDKIADMISQFKEFISPIGPIQVVLSGFKFFDNAIVGGTAKNPYVATVDVAKGAELSGINRKLLQFNAFPAQQARAFDPHVTLAYNDVTEEKFTEIKRYLADRDFDEKSTIDAIALYENTGFGNERILLSKLELISK
ncbi:MAG: 2'-5' RNA ligase family protein [Patescibacteria group bacterium]|jgi:2'-5' RNA ligase